MASNSTLNANAICANDAKLSTVSVSGTLLVNHSAPAAAETLGDNHTLTIAELLTGVAAFDGTAARNLVSPTAALAVAGVSGVSVGDCIDFSVINTGTAGADETLSVTAGTGATLVGFMDVENPATTHDAFSSGSGLFRIRFTNVTGGSEAYTIYRLA